MTTALSNLFSLERQRARFRSDRIDNHHSEDEVEDAGANEEQRLPAVEPLPTATAAHQSLSSRRSSVRNRSVRRSGVSSAATTTISSSLPTVTPIVASVGDTATSGQGLTTIPHGAADNHNRDTANESSSPSSLNVLVTDTDEDDADLDEDVESPRGGSSNATGSPESLSRIPILMTGTRNTLTLAELEEERELARRRSSLCILLASFVLFRLWVSAIQEGDFGLMLLCLMGTSWTARWISYNREREEELDRRIAHYLEHGGTTAEGGGSGNGDPTMERSELRMLSFQAQLALAIMESQRQMMQGGYGHPDGTDQQPGVSDEARAQWQHIKFQATTTDDATPPPGTNQAGYGSVAQKDKDSDLDGDGPHCSICLSEYEDGDSVVKLPCNHLYHDECISSWTSNHVKCPLCNYDLESSVGDSVSEIV